MSHIIRQVVYELPSTDVDGNVLFMRTRKALPLTTGYRSVYEELSIYVPKTKVSALGEWYERCQEHFGRDNWPKKLDALLIEGLSFDEAKRRIDFEMSPS